MSRPTTKSDLIEVATSQYNKLLNILDSMTEEYLISTFVFDADLAGKEAHWKRDKNTRDVLVHLYEWHQLLLNWVKSNLNGVSMPFLPAPYNWKSYGKMNVGFWEKHQNTSLSDSMKMLKESHADVINMINEFSGDQLFAKNHIAWTGTSTLGSYCASATSSHYDWAMKKMKKHNTTYKSADQRNIR